MNEYATMSGSDLVKNWEEFFERVSSAPEEYNKYMRVWGECDGLICDKEDIFLAWLDEILKGDNSQKCVANFNGWHLTGRLHYRQEVPEWIVKKISVDWPGYNMVWVKAID